MPIEMQIHNVGDHFTNKHQRTITELFREISPFLVQRFSSVDSLFIVRPFASTIYECDPPLDVWGVANDQNLSTINCEPSSVNVWVPEWRRQFWAAITHETHHNARLQAKQAGQGRLEDSLAWDGLAVCTEIEMGLKASPYARAIRGQQEWERVIQKAKLRISKEAPLSQQEYWDWFYGTKKFTKKQDKIKRWTGYTLGFAIVAGYCNHFKK